MNPKPPGRRTEPLPESRILVVDDDPHAVRSLGRLLHLLRPVVTASTVAEALDQLPRHSWCAWIIDVHLADECGLDFLERARADHPGVPATILSAQANAGLVNRATRLGAQYIAKGEDSVELVVEFARYASMLERSKDERVARTIGALSRGGRLTATEHEVMVDLTLWSTPDEIAARRGVSANTVKTHIASLLTKLRLSSVEKMRATVYAEKSRAPTKKGND